MDIKRFTQKIDTKIDKINEEREKEKLKEELEQKKQNFKDSQNKLAETTAKYLQEYGREHYLTKILISFLDVSIQMRSTIETMEAISDSIVCVGEAIGCIDGIQAVCDNVIVGSLATSYGRKERRERKKKLKAAIRNNTGRMYTITNSLLDSQKFADELAKSLGGAAMRMQKMTGKKMDRKNKKAKGGNVGYYGSDKAEAMIKGVVESKGGTYEGPVPGESTAAPTPAAPSAPAGDGIYDI